MLSAIAARKAAQALQAEERIPELERGTSPSPQPEDLESVSPTKTSTKRKFSAKNFQLVKKRKKTKQVKPRYYEEPRPDTPKEQLEEDVILVDSDTSGSGESDLDGSKFLQIDLQIVDSSESEDEKSVSDAPGLQLPIKISTLAPSYSLTTCPLDGTTVFPLSREETQALSPLAGAATLVALPHGERISLLGAYAFTILKGSVTIYGTTLPPSRTPHRSYAPRSSPVPVIEGLAISGSAVTLEELPSRLHVLMETQSTLVLFQELSTGIEGLGRICKVFQNVFEPSRRQNNMGDSSLGIPGVYVLSTQTKDIQPFLLPAAWERSLSSVLPSIDHAIYLVRGPKKSGKSTFSRVLVNRLLMSYQKVAYLECDLGQSEFTPAGMVALNIVDTFIFGPPFTHPTIPFRAHYIGATTPRSSPSHYLDAIHSLIQSYRIDVQTPDFSPERGDDSRISDHIPLVVNTMGWTKGLGADLNRKIEDIIQPTDIFEFEPSSPKPLDYPDSGVETTYHSLTPVTPSILSQNFTPADHRSLNILSYLHATFSPPSSKDPLTQVTAIHWSTALPLCAQLPWEVACTPTFQRVFLTGAGVEDVVSPELGRVLNGALVALVTCDPDTLDHDAITTIPTEPNSPAPLIPYIQGSSPPAPATSCCHGLALIRGVSTPTQSDPSRIHVLTPLPGVVLAQANVLVKGELEIPVWGMLDFTHENGGEGNGVPYLRWGKGDGLGGERRRVRRNLMRKGQM